MKWDLRWSDHAPDGEIKTSSFKPFWWARNPHLQTLAPNLLRQRCQPCYQRERLTLPDNDFLDIDWVETQAPRLNDCRATVLIVHGLEGSSNSHYVRGLVTRLVKQKMRIGVMHHRGCSGEPNRKPFSYHSGKTDDLNHVAQLLRNRDPSQPLFVVGFSLGGNVLLKWLGETSDRQTITAAIAVSIPFELGRAADHLNQGFARIYQWRLVHLLRQSVLRKHQKLPLSINIDKIKSARSFREFDGLVTAPLNLFESAEDYYQRSSSRQFLKNIRTPTLILHAKDDPFLPANAIPTKQELSAYTKVELSDTGGHVGFIASENLFRPAYWLENRIADYICAAA